MSKKETFLTHSKDKKRRKEHTVQFPTQKGNKSIFIQDMRDDIECNKIDL